MFITYKDDICIIFIINKNNYILKIKYLNSYEASQIIDNLCAIYAMLELFVLYS